MAAEGLIAVASKDGQAETIARLQKSVTSRGMTVFAHVDHAAGAKEVGLELRPTDLFIFGSPSGGTPLMQFDQSMGIELPLKALVFKDASGNTFISYDDPEWFAKRHGLGETAKPVIEKMKAVLNAVAHEAAGSK